MSDAPSRIIVVAGAARSGTSWLGQIFDSAPTVAYRFQPFFSYAFRNKVTFEASGSEWAEFFRQLHGSEDPFLLQTDKREAGLYPQFDKTDAPVLCLKTCRYQYLLSPLLAHTPAARLVGIVRDPRAVMNSWIHNDKEFPPDTSVREHWRFGGNKNGGLESEFFGYYKWKELAHLYLDLRVQDPERATIVRYERLVRDPVGESRRLFEFVGLPFEDQTNGFLLACHQSHSDSRYGVFKSPSVARKWEQTLPSFIRDEIERDLRGTRLAQFLDEDPSG